MQHRIDTAQALDGYQVALIWSTGDRSVVDLSDLVARGGVCAPMRDPQFFKTGVTVIDDGYALGWPGDVAFSADSLWLRAHPEEAADHAAAQ